MREDSERMEDAEQAVQELRDAREKIARELHERELKVMRLDQELARIEQILEQTTVERVVRSGNGGMVASTAVFIRQHRVERARKQKIRQEFIGDVVRARERLNLIEEELQLLSDDQEIEVSEEKE